VRIGLVLGAGGSVGVAYHGAVIAALERATGWDPRSAEVLVGTSAGSITAAMLRAGVPAGDLVRISEDQPLSEEGAHLAELGRPHRPRPHVTDFLRTHPVASPRGVVHGLTHPCAHPAAALVAALLPAGGIPTDPISEGVNAVFSEGWPSESLWICAVDLRTGKRVVFGQPGAPPAHVGSAVAASSAIPAYFRPVSIGGRTYVDGGIHSMVNLDLVAGSGLDLVIVSSPMSRTSGRPGIDSVIRRPLSARLHGEVAALRRSGVHVVAIEPSRRVTVAMGLNPMDARRRGPVSRATTSAVEEWLAGGAEGRKLAATLTRAAASGVGPPDPEPALLRRPSA
jgi:NTE family protein